LWKRALDLTGCLIALPLLLLCALAMAIVTKLVSPGPLLFRQERVGYQGRRFRIYKFRSMHVRADTVGHQNHFKELVASNAPMVKLDSRGDARLLPGAWLLRATGLDELPQIINVLRGDMSLVGPRPCLPTEAELYLPWQRERFDALPGLTGLWQVSGKNRTTFDEMMRLDIRYARSRTWLMDLRIIAMTIPALIVQVYDTKVGRRSTKVGAHTAAPFLPGRSLPPMITARDELEALAVPDGSSSPWPAGSGELVKQGTEG
jgi:lipopolysaccharide/colanic/teichoic acid biosynthesis glycosyltransferase